MSYTIKPFEDLDVMDDFLMNAIANDEEVNEIFFRTLLSGLLQRKIGRIKVSAQRVIPAISPDMMWNRIREIALICPSIIVFIRPKLTAVI